ncbi:MAG: TetR/AcrR family transcriptional regulator [Microthrixaceae bacterium]
MAADIVATSGVDGLTMAALAEASDYAPASLYTYFPSRSALVAALQQRALTVLAQVAHDSVAAWDESLQGRSTAPVAALARLWAFSRLLLSAPEHHPREFMLQQQLLVSPDAEDASDAALVVPVAMAVLDVPRSLLERARIEDALNGGVPTTGPLGDEIDIDLFRTLTWLTSLNGALLADGLATGLPTTGALLGSELTRGLMIGWGAEPQLVETARELAVGLDVPGTVTTSRLQVASPSGGPITPGARG